MKRKNQFRKDAAVLAATSQQVAQIDQLFLNAISNLFGNILIRVGNFFKKDAKVLSIDLGNANKLSDADEHSKPVVALVPTASETLARQSQPNAPDEAVRTENVKVISADGMHVGNVERVFTESTFDQITHLLVSKEIPAQKRKLIPIKWVQTMGKDAVHLHVTKDLVEELADASIIW